MKNIKNYTQFNEGILDMFSGKKTVSFRTDKAFTSISLTRKSFNVDKVEDGKLYLSDDDNEEEVVLDVSSDDIKMYTHLRDGRKMLQTYMIDNKTKREVRKVI